MCHKIIGQNHRRVHLTVKKRLILIAFCICNLSSMNMMDENI
jgi:hypothetical protein